MARAVTADELVKLRSDGQKSELFLAILKPATVYSARINQATFNDPLAEITYDTGTGTLASVLPGMTLYVGSAAGGYDKGIFRIRKAPSATVFYIGETSEIAWADNDYLTVVDEFGLWPRHLRLVGPTAYMDYDIGYSDQHALLAPYPILGPDAVLWLPTGGTVQFLPDASASWVLGSTISSYLWAAPGASATLNLNSATPTITYNAAGSYRVSCLVTAANGKTATGYRTVRVFSDAAQPVTQFELLSCAGSYEGGGWEFSVRMFAEAAIADVRDRARVILFARDWYGSAAGGLGPVMGYENIIASGWIDGESVSVQSDIGLVEFTVQGPQFWLEQMPGYPVGIERTSAAATAWTQLQGLTVDHGLWHLLHWRSTASLCMDAYLQGDTRSLPVAEAPATSIWAQLETLGFQTILAKPVCDRYGRLYCQTDTQFLPTAARASIPVVQEITRDDWSGTINVERATSRRCAMLQLSGIQDDTGGPLMSWARGGVFTLYGTAQSVENLLLDNQADANALAGNYFAWLNNEFPNVDLGLAQNNRMIGIAPRQRIALSLAAGDTPRGLTWVSKNLLPRRVSYEFDAKSGHLTVQLECEAESGGTGAIDGQTVIITPPPLIGNPDIGFTIPDFNEWGSWPALGPLPIGFDPPTYMPGEPQVPIDPSATCPTDAPANGPYVVPISGTIGADGKFSAYGGIGVVIRTSTHGNRTRYELRGIFEKLVDGVWQETTDDAWYVVEGISASGTVVATGVHDPVTNLRVRSGYLDAPAATPIAYLGIRIIADLFRPTTITTIHAGHPFLTVTPGLLKWGLWGTGIWVSYVGLKMKNNYALPLDSFIASTIDASPRGTSQLTIKHNLYAVGLDNAYLKTKAEGGFGDLNLGGLMWTETFSIASSYLSDKHEWVLSSTGTQISSMSIDAYYPLLGAVELSHFMTAYPVQTYRMHLTQTTLWNVCPRTS
ncbi:MAG: hypothetical protein ACYC36_00340 [Bellilinea sp.]